MTDKEKEVIAIIAALETRAQIAEAKADLALEILARKATSSPEEMENDPHYPFNTTFEKMQTERDIVASIAFKTLAHFLGGNANVTKETVHDAKSKIEKQRMELENTIIEELMKTLSS